MLDELAGIVKNNVLKTLGYFAQNSQTGQQMIQKGVYRTNCLDCLDRTNVTQARISLLVLCDILAKLQNQSGRQGDYNSGGYEAAETFIAMHKRMWSNCGDRLSQQYTGTNSNITRVI